MVGSGIPRNGILLLVGILETLLLPLVVVACLFGRKTRSGLAERLGFGRWKKNTTKKASVWFHVASIGEFNGIKPLVVRVVEHIGSDEVLLTTTSHSASLEIERTLRGVRVAILPFDVPYLQKKSCK